MNGLDDKAAEATGAVLFSWGLAAIDIVGPGDRDRAIDALRTMAHRFRFSVHPSMRDPIADVIEDDDRVASLVDDCMQVIAREERSRSRWLN